MDTTGKADLGTVLVGAKISPLDDDLRFDSAFLLIKSIDPDGVPQWGYRTTSPMNLEELLGALIIQVEIIRRKILDSWDAED